MLGGTVLLAGLRVAEQRDERRQVALTNSATSHPVGAQSLDSRSANMKYKFARECADRLASWLGPISERAEIAGSIRRQKAEVADVDLVVIPRVEIEKDIFGTAIKSTNVTWREIDRRATADGWQMLRAGAEIVSWKHKGVQVDVFFTEPQYWGSMLLCKTGSKEHNIWLANYAIAQGGKWHPNHGLYLRNRRISDTEEAIYDALRIAYIPPERREAHVLPFAGLIRKSPSEVERMSR